MKSIWIGAPEIKHFHSRRNRVTLNEMVWDRRILPVVVKEYPDAYAALREYRLLRRLSSLYVNVPSVYGVHENVLYMQYIEGTLLTHIIDAVSSYSPRWIARLAEWFYGFHKANMQANGAVMLKDDANLRNFIFYQDDFYALDFEAEIFGRPEQDIAECCAYILSNNPPFTREKFDVINKFIDCYCKLDNTVDKRVFKEEVKKSLKNIAGFRKRQEGYILDSLPLVDRMAH
ncbi:MAG: hypothetical protein KBA08_07405 [Firmicutes bacterium]|nr:hypothetical protein [Bacillota bacterium]